MKKKLYYVSEMLLEDVGDYLPMATGIRSLRVYEIVDGKFKEFCDIEHDMEKYSLEVLRDYLLECFDNNPKEICYDENDYEFIEL